jgi:hypothetical protein
MPFIVPLKRKSISGSTYFSKYKELFQDRFFVLQVRKDPSTSTSRPPYRIVTRGENQFHEV